MQGHHTDVRPHDAAVNDPGSGSDDATKVSVSSIQLGYAWNVEYEKHKQR